MKHSQPQYLQKRFKLDIQFYNFAGIEMIYNEMGRAIDDEVSSVKKSTTLLGSPS